ncbi:MAG: glycosyltransferase [Phycisphaerales bacterium]|nr:glycosyltransferase [Phycisphaerales bacterium]
MPDRPLLSIVTPCRDAARWLPRGLESVASQAEPGLVEHIIMDGGSTDGTRDIIAAYAAAHPGLVSHWESTPDGGQSDAINKGFAHARGEFGAWLNADDWYEPGGLTAVIGALRAEPDVLVARCRFVNEGGNTVWQPRPPEPISLGSLCRLRSRWFAGWSMAQPEVFFRLSLFRAAGGLNADNHYSMDHELWLALLERGARFVTLEAPVACMGVHEGQKTRDNRATVRSILAHTSAAMERRPDLMGGDLAAARAEIGAVRAKLACADALIARWRSVREPAPADPGENWDEQVCAALAGSPTLRAAQDAARSAHAAATAEALGFTAQHAPAGPLRVLALVRRDAMAIQHLIRVLPRRALGISVAAPSRAGLEHAMAKTVPALAAGVHRAHAALLDGPRAADPHPGERFDLILTDGVLLSSPDGAALLGSLWPWLAPGGVLVQLAEPRPTPNLEPYLRWLERRLAETLSADGDIRLDPKADSFLELALVGSPDAWRVAHTGALGIDVPEILGALENAACLLERRYGGLNFHPLTPFPCVGPAALAGDDGWGATVWTKVK